MNSFISNKPLEFWLVTTDHQSERLLFRDDEDFRVAMNYVAIVKHTTDANILAFILMSNHVHFILDCPKEKAKVFIDRFKMLYSRYFLRKNGVSEFLRRINIDIRPLSMGNNSLPNAIAYVLMNSVAAKLCVFPNEYPWGSGRAYFRNDSSLDSSINGVSSGCVKLGSMSGRSQWRLLKSCVKINPEWLVLNNGYISPESYVSVKFVENLYGTPSRMKYYLDKSSKAPKQGIMWESMSCFSDQIVRAASIETKRMLFQKGENDLLNENQARVLVQQLRRRFNSDINQVRRTTGISQNMLLKFFDGF